MGISYVYKKFKPEDKAIIPFNAHKQYDFDASQASLNNITYVTSSYTSESISLYSSASSIYGGDGKNVIKYNQIDHLFYRDHLKKFGTKKDPIHYLKQFKELYKNANILSIPSGLYGFEIKKSSFYLSSSTHELVDDSYGNLIVRGTDVDNYPNDVQQNVFRLGPVKGFKKHDLKVYDDYAFVEGREFKGDFQYIYKKFYRKGQHNANGPTYHTSNNEKYPKGYYSKDEDDSYYFNELKYKNIDFNESSVGLGAGNQKWEEIRLRSNTSSYIEAPHNARFNFNTDENFAISFYFKPYATGSVSDPPSSEKRYILAKSTTETTVTNRTKLGSGSRFIDKPSGPQFPFEIYLQSSSIYFERSDGNITNQVTYKITDGLYETNQQHHILCQLSSSTMELYYNSSKVDTTTNTLVNPTRNKANLYIGSKGTPNSTMLDTEEGGTSDNKLFNGTLSNINIWSRPFSQTQINNISSSINASPYIGNIFYQSGFAIITNPNYITALSDGDGGTIKKIQFQGSHLIYEHEYQCTVQEHEFNSTTNTSVRKNKSTNPYELESFTSSSFFKPYITTIGLYNEAYELLAIGKLGQPIRCSDETDTTFIIRYDT
jgi:hypothetical protein